MKFPEVLTALVSLQFAAVASADVNQNFAALDTRLNSSPGGIITRDFGILFSCSVAGNGGVAGCFDDGLTFNPFLVPPVATVELRCGSGVTNDGQILMPELLSESASISSVQKSGLSPESSTTAEDELESKVKVVNDQLLDRRAKLKTAQ